MLGRNEVTVPIDVKQAVAAATNHARSLYEPDVAGIRLEEVERADEGGVDVWRVTLSFYVPDVAPASPMDSLLQSASLTLNRPPKVSHLFKVFVVGVPDGNVRAMRIRERQS